MIITCPGCGASFNIKPEAIGPRGRMVKCSKCAHRWRALPEGGAAEDPQEGPAYEADAPPEAADAAPDPAAASPERPDTTLAEQLAAGDGETAVAAEAAENPPLPPSLRLKEMLGTGDDDADDAPEEPGARSRSGRKPGGGPRKPRGGARIVSLFCLILLIAGVASVAVIMQQQVMMWLPATQRLYALAGVAPDALGKGLEIVEPKPTKEIDGTDEILVVEGEVRNTTGAAIDVPLMRGALLDKKGQELQIWTFTAAKPRIDAGESARYRTEFRNPPPDADRLDITFTRSDRRADGTQRIEAQGQ